MEQRRVTQAQVSLAVIYGTRNRQEEVCTVDVDPEAIALARRYGVDLSDDEGLRLICDKTGKVITLFRRSVGDGNA